MLKKLGTLKVKFSIITFLTYMTLLSVVLQTCYVRFYRNMINSYKALGEELLSLAADDINIDSIPGYLSGDYDQTEYDQTLEKLNKYPQYFQEVFYLYAYTLKEDGRNATYLFDAKIDHDKNDTLGDNYELEEDIINMLDKYEKNGTLEPVTDNTSWGYLLTCSKPLIDSNGNCQGFILVDFNLTEAKQEISRFIFKLFLVVFVLMCMIFGVGMRAVTGRITRPIEKMYLCLSNFKYATNKDREDNIEQLKSLDIHTNAEIQSLYEALVATTEDSYLYLHEYQEATEKLGVANEKAYTDALTGFRNKNAYEDRIKKYQKKLNRGEKLNIAVIMVDVNNLKYVNDTFGHKRGDEYIKGCCNLIAGLCKHSSIYRIGGDEFVVILKNEDFKNRRAIYDAIKKSFSDSYTDSMKQPWERYSASIGITDCQPYDTNMSEVFKRADSAMYKAKSEFKEQHGSYR